MGVSEYPPCRGFFDVGCHIVKRLINTGTVYLTYAQDHSEKPLFLTRRHLNLSYDYHCPFCPVCFPLVIPAQYFRDQADLKPYFEHNDFLRDINNERASDRQPGQSPGDHLALLDQPELPRNQTYKQNMLSLNNFVMFSFA